MREDARKHKKVFLSGQKKLKTWIFLLYGHLLHFRRKKNALGLHYFHNFSNYYDVIANFLNGYQFNLHHIRMRI